MTWSLDAVTLAGGRWLRDRLRDDVLAGSVVTVIDLRGVVGRGELFEAFSRGLRFPAWSGSNLDALAEGLRERRLLERGAEALVVRGWGEFASQNPAFAGRVLSMLRSVVAQTLAEVAPGAPDPAGSMSIYLMR